MRARTASVATSRAARVVVLTLVATVAALNVVGTGSAGAGALRSERPTRLAAGQHLLQPAAGQVTAHDGKFWLGSTAIVLKGFNVGVGTVGLSEVQQMAGYGANFVRLRVHWADLEPNPPVLQGTVWHHSYDAINLQHIIDDIQWNYQNGIYTVLDNHACSDDETCSYFGFPTWQYQAPYNSHGVTYPLTPDGVYQAQGDLWTDSLRQQFQLDEWKYLVTQLKSQPGLIGYEILNEPQPGYYANDHTTTQMILDWQLGVAKALRALDPARVIVFATRTGYGPGLQNADLSGFASLTGNPVGNSAFDVHDYFGARWGDGINENTLSTMYSEATQVLYDNTNLDIVGPYIGTTAGQVRFLQQLQTRLNLHGQFPYFVGETGTVDTDPGAYLYFGTSQAAFSYLGSSWAVMWSGHLGITANSGTTLKPYAYLVIQRL